MTETQIRSESNSIQRLANAEVERHNKEMERYNQAMIDYNNRLADIQEYNAKINAYNAEINAWNARTQETVRMSQAALNYSLIESNRIQNELRAESNRSQRLGILIEADLGEKRIQMQHLDTLISSMTGLAGNIIGGGLKLIGALSQ